MSSQSSIPQTNLWISVLVCVFALLFLIVSERIWDGNTENKQLEHGLIQDAPKGDAQDLKKADKFRQTTDKTAPADKIAGFAISEVPSSSNPKDLADETTNEIPAVMTSQIKSPPQELPEDLKEQLSQAPIELPPDLKAQLEQPPEELPEDIKRALETPPRPVSIEEVNNPPKE